MRSDEESDADSTSEFARDSIPVDDVEQIDTVPMDMAS